MGRKPKIEKIHVYVLLIYFVYSRKEYSIAKELYSNKNSLKKRIFNETNERRGRELKLL